MPHPFYDEILKGYHGYTVVHCCHDQLKIAMAGKDEWLLGDKFDELRLKTRPISYTHDNKKSFRCIPPIAIILLPSLFIAPSVYQSACDIV